MTSLTSRFFLLNDVSARMDPTPLADAVASLHTDDRLPLSWGPESWTRLAPHLELRDLRAGDLLLRRGAHETSAWLVESGHLQVFVDSGAPLTHRISRLRAGTLVGEPALFIDAPRMASVEALTPCRLWTITRRGLEDFGRSDTALALGFVRAAAALMAVRMRANLERGIPAV